MDNNNVSIKYSEVKNEISFLKDDCLSQMKNIFSEFENTMNRVGGGNAFVGEGNETLQARYKKLSSRFSEFENLILRFADQYEKALASTQQTEQQLSQDAGNLNS